MQNGSLTRMPGRAPGSTLARVGSIPAGDDVLDPDEPTYDLPGSPSCSAFRSARWPSSCGKVIWWPCGALVAW